MKEVSVFEATDGQKFDTREACEAHENALESKSLLGMEQAHLDGALDGSNKTLGWAIERFARKVAQGRIDRGDVRRRKADAPAVADPAKALEPKDGTAAP